MINVIASVNVVPGKLADFLAVFKANVPAVRDEVGCIEYAPTVDVDSGLPPQIMDENVVTIIEKWETLQALQDHLKAPHMIAYKAKVNEMVSGVSLKVLQEA